MQALRAVSDSQLIDSFLSGDQKSFEALVRKYQGRVYSAALLVVKDKYVAEDILQDSFIRFFKKLQAGEYKEIGKLLPYLLRVANNLAIDHVRRAKLLPRITTSDGTDVFLLLNVKGDSALRDLEKKEMQELLKDAIAQLPPDQREVILLRYFAGMSFKEIADITGLNFNTALGRMRYAVRSLRKQLLQYKENYDPNLYSR